MKDDNIIIAWLTVVVTFGFVAGVVISQYIAETKFENKLKAVGIDRIEYCHNIHSNWHEIVWIDSRGDEGKEVLNGNR